MNDDVMMQHWAKDIAIKTLDSTFSSVEHLLSKGHLVKSFVQLEAIDPSSSQFEVQTSTPQPHFENMSFDIK
jgi:hypothetical protein